MKAFFQQLNYYLAKVYVPIWHFLVWLYEYIKYALFPRYKLTVSYNAIFGDADDKDYIVKKQDKYLKFTTDDDELVEVRGAEGLNYRIEQL